MRFGHPAWMSVAVAACSFATFAATRWITGHPMTATDPRETLPLEPSAVSGIVLSLLLGYMIFGGGFLNRCRRRELARIEATEAPAQGSTSKNLRRSRFWGALAAGAGVAFVLWVPRSYGTPLTEVDPDYFWFLFAGPLFLWMLARAAFFSLRHDETLGAIRSRPVDLLDLGPVLMFGRLGVQQSLIWVVGTSIATPMLLVLDLSILVLPLMVATMGVAVGSLMLHVRGLRPQIRAAKEPELARVMAEIRSVRERPDTEPERAGHLADLLGYRAYIDSIPESSIDTSSLTRFLVYLLIPIGSWVAGALVERLIDALFE
jgi:hypothetical protein